VHGTDYEREMKKPAATPQDVYDNAIKPHLLLNDPSRVTYAVAWNSSNAPSTVTNNAEVPRINTVSVTVTYTWIPEWYLSGPITFTSTSTVPMSY